MRRVARGRFCALRARAGSAPLYPPPVDRNKVNRGLALPRPMPVFQPRSFSQACSASADGAAAPQTRFETWAVYPRGGEGGAEPSLARRACQRT